MGLLMELRELEKRVRRLEQTEGVFSGSEREEEEFKNDVRHLDKVTHLLWEAFFALEWLVRLKDEKEAHGKTDRYLEARDAAWSDARAVVSEIRKLRDEGYE